MPDLPAIPSHSESASWWELPIAECGEPLVALTPGPRLRLKPVYAQLGFAGASAVLSLRSGTLTRLQKALEALPEHLGFVVFDGFRPLAVQQALWEWQWAEVTRDYPHFTEAEVYEKVRHFVAEPTPDPTRPTPHRTGGAVDLTLFSRETGAELDLGTAFDEATDATVTDWFERYPQEPITDNRRLLYTVLTEVGFANYPNEWWHFEYGTRRWAGHRGMNLAVYGSAE